MAGSGTSGTLRLQQFDVGDLFLVALGVENNAGWCDIQPDLTMAETGTFLNPQYYNESSPLNAQREKQLSDCSVKSASGLTYEVKFTVPTGNDLEAYIIIS